MEIKVDTGALRQKMKEAFEDQWRNVQSDLDMLKRRGTVHEAAMEGRQIENRRMMCEVDNIISQLQLDAENSRHSKEQSDG